MEKVLLQPSFEVTHLAEGQKYHLKVRAENEAGLPPTFEQLDREAL